MLLHTDLLCRAAKSLFGFVDACCASMLRVSQHHSPLVNPYYPIDPQQVLDNLTRIAEVVMLIFLKLLLETRREEPLHIIMRERMIPCLYTLYIDMQRVLKSAPIQDDAVSAEFYRLCPLSSSVSWPWCLRNALTTSQRVLSSTLEP